MSAKLVFFDLETRSDLDLNVVGNKNYTKHLSTHIIVIAALFPDMRHGVWAPPDRRLGLDCDDWLLDEWNRCVESGEYYFVAWNAPFDFSILEEMGNEEGILCPPLERVLDAQTVAEAYSLPGKLAKCGQTLKVPVVKDARGRILIQKHCNSNKPWPEENKHTQQDLRDLWKYADTDVLSLAAIWRNLRPWTQQEWVDYWVLQRANRRGLLFDIPFCEEVIKWGEIEHATLNKRLQKVTGDETITLSCSQRKIAWMYKHLAGTPLESAMMVKKLGVVTDKETGYKSKKMVNRKSLDGGVQEALRRRIEELSDDNGLPKDLKIDDIVEFLDILERGNGVATKKFVRAVALHHEGRIHDHTRCSATVTGRHAGRGVQLDNVPRDKLETDVEGVDPVLDTIDLIMAVNRSNPILGNGKRVAEFSLTERQEILERFFGLPIDAIFARLLRPTIIAPEDRWLVWGDWSGIEARTLPWLAKHEPALEPYRRGECVYSQAAEVIYDIPWKETFAGYKAGDPDAKYHRLVGKVATLALGYGGGPNALLNMARGYGVRLSFFAAQDIVHRWRDANRWALRFWSRLDDAAWTATREPGTEVRVGRVRYRRVGHDLWCFLPDGRPIIYPEVRMGQKYREDWDAHVQVLTYRKKYGTSVVRGELYGGLAAENVTQGTATGSLLRDLMRRLDGRGMDLLKSTHDEVLLEVDDPEEGKRVLYEEMTFLPEWAEGLPLEAEVAAGEYYGK